MDHLHDAAETIARAVKATADPHSGWSKYTAAGDAAIRALVEAGWTPPGEEGDNELQRLHKAIAGQQAEVAAAWTHTYRIEAERDAARAFRVRYLDLWFQLERHLTAASEAARVGGESEPAYTAERVIGWLQQFLDRSDKAAERAKTKSLAAKQAEKPATPDAQDGLFESAS